MTQQQDTVPIFHHRRPLFSHWLVVAFVILLCAKNAVPLPSQTLPKPATTILASSRSLNTYHFQTRIYTVDDGLPTNLTKDIVADKHGFVWIATDAGLVRFDGYHFMTISEGLPSRYVKKLLLLRDGRLLAATDGGVVEIDTDGETPRIHVLLRASQQPSDSTIVYPKTLFEDAAGTLWISEPNAIVRVLAPPLLKKKSGSPAKPRLRRYQFPAEYASNSVVRSFMFAQDAAGTMLVSGYAGYCYWYNAALDTFSLLAFKQPVGLIHDICAMRKERGQFLAATQKGILNITLQAATPARTVGIPKNAREQYSPLSMETRLIPHLQEASAIMQSKKSGMMFCGAWYNGIHLLSPKNLAEQREISPLQRINTLWEARNGIVWASSDQGMCLIAPSPIDRLANTSERTPFLNHVAADTKGNMYGINGESLYKIDRERLSCSVLASKPQGSAELFSIACDSAGAVWVSSLSGWIMRWQNGTMRVVSEKNTVLEKNKVPEGSSKQGLANASPSIARSIYAMVCDASGTLWCALEVTPEQALEGVPTLYSLRYDASHQGFVQRLYGARDGVDAPVASVYALPRGGVLLGLSRPILAPRDTAAVPRKARTQVASYILQYKSENNTFSDAGKPLPEAALKHIERDGGWMTVYDIALENKRLLLATSCGMLRYTLADTSSEKQPQNRTVAECFTVNGVLPTDKAKALAIAPSGTVWIGTDVGAAKFWNGTMATVHQASGLVSRTISRQGIVIDPSLGLWIATSNGLYTSSDAEFVSSEPPLSATPRLISARLIEQGASQSIFADFFHDSVSATATATAAAQSRRMLARSSFPAFSVLEFDVSSLMFPSAFVMFKTCVMAGNDTIEAYSMTSAESALRLTNLADGEYRVFVQARKEGSGEVWSTPLELHFRIEPPFYRSSGAYLGYIALTLMIGGLSIVAVRSVRHKQALVRSEENAQRLQELVAERTGELRQTNSDLATANSEISRQMEIQAEQAREIELANSMLQERNEELKDINQEKSELMGIVAHDLKNPISAVRNLAALIEGEVVQDKSEILNISQHISRTANQMLDLVIKVLDNNRLEEGAMKFYMVALDIAPIVEGVVWQYQTSAEVKNIRLHFSTEASNSVVLTDEIAIAQVMDNIISNAVKYSPFGKNVFVRITSSNDAVRIEVQDEGPGISPEDMQKLFGKFARLTAQPTGGEHSTGLGLSIVKKMVEAMNGKVWCESEVGKGATFIVELRADQR